MQLDVWRKTTIDGGHDDWEEAPPFVSVCGDLAGGNYEFTVNGRRVAKVAGDLFNLGNVFGATGRYGMQVSPGCDVALFILLAAYVDELYAERKGGRTAVRRTTMMMMRRRTRMGNSGSIQSKRRREKVRKGQTDVDDVGSGGQQEKQEDDKDVDGDGDGGIANVNQKRIILDEQQGHRTGKDDITIRKNIDVATSQQARDDEGENDGEEEVKVVKHMRANSTTTSRKLDEDCDSLADQFEKNLPNM